MLGVVANQPMVKGGVLFVDSADKVARFVWLYDAFSLPLVFLADVPGFMIGTEVERQGIIRRAKLIPVSEATVPKICVVVRKAYGAGLYMAPRRSSSPTPPWPCPPRRSRSWAGGRRQRRRLLQQAGRTARGERPAEWSGSSAKYREDVDLVRLAADLVVDSVVDPDDLRPNWPAAWPLPQSRSESSVAVGTGSHRYELLVAVPDFTGAEAPPWTPHWACAMAGLSRPFKVVLVVKPGEIAVRVLPGPAGSWGWPGWRSTPTPTRALHVREADRAVGIGGAAVADSYLDQGKLLAAAAEARSRGRPPPATGCSASTPASPGR